MEKVFQHYDKVIWFVSIWKESQFKGYLFKKDNNGYIEKDELDGFSKDLLELIKTVK